MASARGIRCLIAGCVVAAQVLEASARRDSDVVATDRTLELDKWNVYDPSGPKIRNVSQGSLGDCYFLAGMAAIAHTHPKALEHAFATKGEKSKDNRQVYKLRFMIDGKERLVAIDDVVPIENDRFLFAKFNDGDNAWPILLEKGFAKLAGSYLGISAGFILETFKAILQCPVDEVWKDSHWTEDFIWKFIATAIDNKWPVGAGTGSTKHNIGTVNGHTYAVMGYGTPDGKTKAIEVYNPWAANRYQGKLAHLSSQQSGNYWIALDEFRTAFAGMTRARYSPTAKLTSLTLKVRPGPHSLAFTMRGNQPFYVQLEFPSTRILPKPCEDYPYWENMALWVYRNGQGKQGRSTEKFSEYHSHRRVTMPGGAGEYRILAVAGLQDMPGISEIVVNIYAEEEVVLRELEFGPKNPVEKTIGGCSQMMWGTQYYELQADTFRGSFYWKHKSGTIVYLSGLSNGFIASLSKKRWMTHYTNFKLADFKCYSKWKHSSFWVIDEARFSKDENDRKPPDASFAKDIQGCDQNKVRQIMDRHHQLDNYDELMAGGDDRLFPPSMSSIGKEGEDCGDSATGQRADCGRLNHWESISAVHQDPTPTN